MLERWPAKRQHPPRAGLSPRSTAPRTTAARSAWCNLTEVCERTGADPDVVQLAALKSWIDLEPKHDPHSVMLTDAGRRLVE